MTHLTKHRPVGKREKENLTESLARLIRIYGLKHALDAITGAILGAVAASGAGGASLRRRPGAQPLSPDEKRNREMLDWIIWWNIELMRDRHPSVRGAAADIHRTKALRDRSEEYSEARMRAAYRRIKKLHAADPERAAKDQAFLDFLRSMPVAQ